MKNFQKIPIHIATVSTTLTAGQQKVTISLKEKLLPFLRGGVAHVFGLLVTQDLDPTFTTAPTAIGNANGLADLKVQSEKGHYIFDGSGADLRAFEVFENNGRVMAPEPDLSSGSTNNFYSARYLSMGPGAGALGSADGEDAWCVPAVLFNESALEATIAKLTDVSADTTAGTIVHQVYAMAAGLDKIVIPPKLQRRAYPCSGNERSINDRARYLAMLMLNSTSHDAISPGDFGQFTLSDRRGVALSAVPGYVLQRAHEFDRRVGQLSPIQGEPQAVTDDNAKVVNGATPTALAAPTAAYQPILWPVEGQSLSRIEIEGPVTLKWTGSQATGSLLVTRILPRSAQDVEDIAQRLVKELGVNLVDLNPRGVVKGQGYSDNPEYAPWTLRFAK